MIIFGEKSLCEYTRKQKDDVVSDNIFYVKQPHRRGTKKKRLGGYFNTGGLYSVMQNDNKPLRLVVNLDGKEYDSYEDKFEKTELKNIYGAVQKMFRLHANKLNAAGAYIYVDASARPDSFDVRGISAEMWENIKQSIPE